MKEALYYEKLDGSKVKCQLCPHGCVLTEGRTGICRGKKNVGGTLFAVNYGLAVSLALDPIEKKPLYHFFPGTRILSTGPNGCNFRCSFCQNYDISQGDVPTLSICPRDLAEKARETGSIGIAYTYSEPLIWYEYVLEAAKEVRKLGLKNVLVSNGFINEAPLKALLPYIDAMNVDIKSMDGSFYTSFCSGGLDPVLRTVRLAHERGLHVEITNLVIPELNDTEDHFQRLAYWISGLSPDIPLHFSRYFPRYKMATPSTPAETLESARSVALGKLNHVFVGNIAREGWSDTSCGNCGRRVIQRSGYSIDLDGLKDGRCCFCGVGLPVVC